MFPYIPILDKHIKYALMYENGKMRPVKLFQKWGRGDKGE
jgi:hypothetical protein